MQHFEFKDDIIALQQKGAPLEGFLRYVQANPEIFENEADLLAKVKSLANEKGWKASYSRNLVVTEDGFSKPHIYTDHTGPSHGWVYHIKAENKRPDVSAVGTVYILDSFKRTREKKTPSPDRAYLKWAGQAGYERTILPKDSAILDVFAIRSDERGVFLRSQRDIIPRKAIFTDDGDYKLDFKVFA